MTRFTESDVEEAALKYLADLGYAVLGGPGISPGGPASERDDYREVVLAGRLRAALARLNPGLPAEAIEDAFRRVMRIDSPTLIGQNQAFHRMLAEGITVEYRRDDGTIAGDRARLVDFENPGANDWLAVNQFTVAGTKNRRPDIVLFLNGLPIGAIELKDPTNQQVDIWYGFNQLQTYKQEIPALFAYNEALVTSNGLEARVGSLTADREWFMPWRTIEGEEPAPKSLPQLQVLLQGLFERRRLLQFLRHFVVFESDGEGIAKKLAGYHQFHAVNRAVEATAQASGQAGDGRAGVVWHTQGSGKSLTMVFYAGRLALDPRMANPTIVVITDRIDLDGQLFRTFCRCSELLGQTPRQAESRDDLVEALRVASGGIVFTTLQKFFVDDRGERFPLLSARRNVVVIADEAHRSQYDFIDGFARRIRDALPNATFIGFTGTPIDLDDRSTRAVFGDYISVYDIQRSIDDGATVPIHYESRLARLELSPEEKPRIDVEFEEVTEGEEQARKERLKTKWAQLEAVVGAEKRVDLVARDIVRHFEERQRVIEGKAMIVCMSRRICVAMFDAIARLRPEWDRADDATGAIKVVMTGSASDPTDWQRHIRNKKEREVVEGRFKDPGDELKLVIVRDMWLTGFDVPPLHTMYLDKPMRGHALMQAIARVNRVFRDKPGGLIVDYLGIAEDLKKALATYTQSGGAGTPVLDQAEAVALMREKFEIVAAMFHGFDYAEWAKTTGAARLAMLPPAQELILSQPGLKERFLRHATELSKAFALAVPHEEAMRIIDDVGFFQAVRGALAGQVRSEARPAPEIDHAVRQIVSGAISSGEVVDIFAAAGLGKPDIGILSDSFLAQLRDMPQQNLAIEVLRKLLNDEIRVRATRNAVQGRLFSEMLERAVRAYTNRALDSAAILQELIEIAKKVRDEGDRGTRMGLTEVELAFYDAIATGGTLEGIMGDEKLREVARQLVDAVRKNTTVDWTVRESVQARLRSIVKRLLIRNGWPPATGDGVARVVIQQAALWADELAA